VFCFCNRVLFIHNYLFVREVTRLGFFKSENRKDDTIILTDMDGTLFVNTEEIHHLASQAAAADFGYELSDKLWTQELGRGHANLYQKWNAHHHNRPAAKGVSEEKFIEQCMVNYGVCVSLARHRQEILNFTSNIDANMSIVTNAHQKTAEKTVEAVGIRQHFNNIVGIDSLGGGNPKPAPDPYIKGLQLYEGQPLSNIILLEDTASGTTSAVAAAEEFRKLGHNPLVIQILNDKSHQYIGEKTENLIVVDAKNLKSLLDYVTQTLSNTTNAPSQKTALQQLNY
jgi:beta-phosphoglucomutase-like phosphatase (HAD superfamily)